MNLWPETEIKWICWNLIGKIREITSRPENANKIMKNLTKTYVKSRHILLFDYGCDEWANAQKSPWADNCITDLFYLLLLIMINDNHYQSEKHRRRR